jgi:hypothetical protein
MSSTLRSKIPEIFGLEPKSKESKQAVDGANFVNDLFILYASYKKNSPDASQMLRDLARAYFEQGTSGVKKLKFSSIELQMAEKLSRLDLLEAYSDPREISVEQINLAAKNYSIHRKDEDEIVKFAIDTISSKKQELIGNVLNAIEKFETGTKRHDLSKLLSAIETENLKGIKEATLGPKTKKLQNMAMSLMSTNNAVKHIDSIDLIISNLNSTVLSEGGWHGTPIAQKKAKIDEIFEAECDLMHLSKFLSTYGVEAKFIQDFKSICDALSVNEELNESKVKANLSFDFSEGIEIGRFGESGQGNCLKSTSPVSYNKSLMNLLGEAYEFQMMFQSGESRLGFMPLHLIRTNKNSLSFFLETEMTYLNDNKYLKDAMSAANNLMFDIFEKEGIVSYDPYKKGEELDLIISSSKMPHYLDFIKRKGDTEEIKIRISALRLDSPVFREAKRNKR